LELLGRDLSALRLVLLAVAALCSVGVAAVDVAGVQRGWSLWVSRKDLLHVSAELGCWDIVYGLLVTRVIFGAITGHGLF
jgi:hypothetical protein